MLVGIGALAFMLWEPLVEGRNGHATLFEIYFKDPFLAYAYLGSIPFFVALYQSLKVLERFFAGDGGRFAEDEILRVHHRGRHRGGGHPERAAQQGAKTAPQSEHTRAARRRAKLPVLSNIDATLAHLGRSQSLLSRGRGPGL